MTSASTERATAAAPARWFVAAACALGVVSYLVRARREIFFQDDAFIFLRYAQNFAHGLGPVWNAGERVEGYTSFLWLLILTGLSALTSQPEAWLLPLTLLLGVGTLAVTFALTQRLTGSRSAAALALLLLATDHTFILCSASGMETRLFGLLAVSAAWLSLRFSDAPSRRGALLLGGCALLLALTRPEGLLLAGAVLAVTALPHLRGGPHLRALLVAGAVCAVGVGAHLAWRRSYYGEWLPNTFRVKVGGLDFRTGLRYAADYARSFPHHALILPVLAALSLRGRRDLRFHLFLLGLVAFLAVYVTAVGGDFMEFRFVDQILPFLYVLAVNGLVNVAAWIQGASAARGAVITGAALIAANLLCHVTFHQRPHVPLTLNRTTLGMIQSWTAIGKWLHRVAQPGEVLATQCAGAIPYYAGMPTIDMLGLNDREIARQPPDPRRRIGHRKLATADYLIRRGVTFVFMDAVPATTGASARQAGGGFFVRLDDRVPAWEGAPICVLLRTTRDRDEVMRSLRARGATVFSERCGMTDEEPAAPQTTP